MYYTPKYIPFVKILHCFPFTPIFLGFVYHIVVLSYSVSCYLPYKQLKMWVRARLMTDANRSCSIDELSKLTTIKELRDRIRDGLAKDLDASRLRLFFAGKVSVRA